MFNFFKKKPTGTVKTFKIGKMHCVSCGINIDGALEDLPGIHRAETSYKKAQVVVEFDPNQVNQQQIKETIIDQGYEVK